VWGSTYPDAPHIFIDDQDLLRAWKSPDAFFLLCRNMNVPKWKRAARTLHVASEASGKVIFTNHPQANNS